MGNLSTLALKDIEEMKVHGRTTANRSPLTLFWTGSGIECNVTGSEFWVEVEADYDFYEPWISILINGAWVARQMLQKGRQWLCVFRNMKPETVKNVQIVKDVQAMSADEHHLLQIHNVKTDGTFTKVEDRKIKLEFIGDSITSGEGTIGAKKEEDWISMWFSSQNDYAVMTAQRLDAEVRIISQSGWGVYTGWDNNPNCALPDYYEKVCGLAGGERNRTLGAQEENDFNAYRPDVVVINLGTNDNGAFGSPEWKDEKTGRIVKQHTNEDGSFNEEDVMKFQNAAVAFLKKVRRCNPTSKILWAYGMLGTPFVKPITDAIAAYQKESGDKEVLCLKLPEMTEEGTGARSHPGVLTHQIASEKLAAKIKEMLA